MIASRVHRGEEVFVGLGILHLVEQEFHRVDRPHLHEDAAQHPHFGKVADKRIFPSLDVGKSGTRKEELLVEKDKLSKMWVLRRILMQMGTVDAMEFLLDKIKDSKTNEDFFDSMNQ